MHSIVLAGGCFWGVEAFFRQFRPLHTQVGYVNGPGEHPIYRDVCEGSGHTEGIRIEYPDCIELPQILASYFSIVDPVSLNRQGNDIGINYRTGIYTNDPKEAAIAKGMLEDLQRHYSKPIQIEVEPLNNFCPAEEEHQNYLGRNPGGYCHIPRSLLHGCRLFTMRELREEYPSLAKTMPAPEEDEIF
ncbi:peptide-methionine (S)-S-oxide reductase MsrA [Allobaculum fili]|uniref:peptide-methionine (S)-S-oxide reductase MsrA n=1 Tax=Allobaculum TaxID=174708 RepID=UPI001E622329|nr:peptide-methionine (S)-S-oxide reductase MsrA [Allobaculum fili]